MLAVGKTWIKELDINSLVGNFYSWTLHDAKNLKTLVGNLFETQNLDRSAFNDRGLGSRWRRKCLLEP